MGFLNYLSSIGNKIKHYTNVGIGHTRRAKNFIRKGIASVNSFLDQVLDQALNFPLLADLAEQFQNNEMYQSYRQMSQELDDVLANSDVIIDNIERYANMVPGDPPHAPSPVIPQAPPAPPLPPGASVF